MGDDGSVQAANTNEGCVIDVVDVCTSDEEMRSAEYVNSIADKLKARYGHVGHIVTMNDTHQLCWRALWSLVSTEGSFLFLRMNGLDSGPTPFALLNEAMEAANDTTQSVNDLKVAFDTWNDHCSALCGTVVEMMESGWNGLRLTVLSPEQLSLTTFNPAG
ncbi:hypothetical protein SARC_03459 [Sphaeroforma arctica JP610]|uniref:Uncharacterized protein n=1 Tax=Sphaeroforma arctica JP610 TaxID=667725 RepID=A0A0L0G7T4_9EUKA|nr:hypothetical protein SARC_03459 [Sphaeroforma arctica JP610]KNC84298.1 hypothetical protein SARC_03459 [Sphaeroforma arctica JP610]|eukprot:XP_014158200.1 hypothetical protein SARC_03459 [Sphaeroforma arctica JP610]